MALQSLTFDRARFRVGSWRGDPHLAYLVPTSAADTLTARSIDAVTAALASRGYGAVVTAAVGPHERDALRQEGFVDRETLHLLRHDLRGLAGSTGGSPRIRRGRRADRPAVLDLDAVTFDEFWHLDANGLQDAIEATPVSRLRVVRDPTVIGYAVAGRSGSQGFLQRLAVDPARQGSGIGRALVIDALRWMLRRRCSTAWVNTQQSNDRALALYRRIGFVPADHQLTVLERPLVARPEP
ncbi:MAG: GNAT family N-acetyltransferase [Acidimicrobiales bacterium]